MGSSYRADFNLGGLWRQKPNPLTLRTKSSPKTSNTERLLCLFECLRVPDLLKPTPDSDDARRERKATANRDLSMLKTALNRAYQVERIASDHAWRRVKPFPKVEEAVVRYLTADEAWRLPSR
jgi:hypothetical protein